MKVEAKLFYGTSVVAVEPPTSSDMSTKSDHDLAEFCLLYMMHRAGRFSSMAQNVAVDRHPKGMVTVRGNGWSVTACTPEYEEEFKRVVKCASLSTAGEAIEFIRQITSTPIPSDELLKNQNETVYPM